MPPCSIWVPLIRRAGEHAAAAATGGQAAALDQQAFNACFSVVEPRLVSCVDSKATVPSLKPWNISQNARTVVSGKPKAPEDPGPVGLVCGHHGDFLVQQLAKRPPSVLR